MLFAVLPLALAHSLEKPQTESVLYSPARSCHNSLWNAMLLRRATTLTSLYPADIFLSES